MEVRSQSGAIGPGPFDADQDHRAEVREPGEELLVTPVGGLEGLDPEQRAFLVEGGGHVDVEMRIDAAGHRSGQSGHGHPFSWWVGVAPHRRDDGQDSDEPCLGKLL
jgi:hypothetical protein